MKEKWTSIQRDTVIAAVGSWSLDAFDFFLLTFLLDDLAKSFSVDIMRVSWAILLTLIARPLGALLFGRAAEKYGRRPILMINIAVFSLMEVASALSPNLSVFLTLRVMYGIAMGGIWGVASSLAMEVVPVRSRGFVSGLFQAGYPAGYLLASIIYGLFYTIGWRGLLLIGVLPVLLIPYIWIRVPESPIWLMNRLERKNYPLLGILIQQWRLVVFMVVLMTCFNFFSHGTQDMYPTFLRIQRALDHQEIAAIAAVYNVAAMLGGLFFGSLSQKLGRRKSIVLAALLALPAIPLWAFSMHTGFLICGAFLMQFMVQGAWGVVPTYLNELAPEGTGAVLPGFVYQLGNVFASVNGPAQAAYAGHNGGNYATGMATVAAVVSIIIVTLCVMDGIRSGTKSAMWRIRQKS
jgi:MFS transporter, SHS family, lactate transporter